MSEELFAKVGAGGDVLNVEVASNDWVIDHMLANPDADYEYVRTAEDAADRPAPGWTYDRDHKRFVPPQPAPSWTEYDPENVRWLPPVPYPTDGGAYVWDEEQGAWIEYVEPDAE